MFNIIALLGAVFAGSYILHRFRGTVNPAKAALLPTAIIGVVLLVFAVIIFISISVHSS